MPLKGRPRGLLLAIHFYDYVPYSAAIAHLSNRIATTPGLWMVLAAISGVSMMLRVLRLSTLLREGYKQKVLVKHCYHNNPQWKEWCEKFISPIIQSAMQLDSDKTNKIISQLSAQISADTAEALSKLSFTPEERNAAIKGLKIFRVANPSQLDLINSLKKWLIEELPYFQQNKVIADSLLLPPSAPSIAEPTTPEAAKTPVKQSAIPGGYDELSAEDLAAFKKMQDVNGY